MPKSAQYVIGVDVGTQSTKAVLVRADGHIEAQHSHSYQVKTPAPLWAQQWPDVWLDAVAICIKGVLAKTDIARTDIKGLCVSSLYGGSGIPVDIDGQPLYPCLIWMDRRAQAQVDWVRSHVNVDRLMDITGNGVDSYYGYTKMLWLRDEEPEVWAKIHQFLPPNTYINAQFTGEVAVDHSSAGNIGGVYDLASRRWSEEALGMLGIPSRMMPERLVASSDVVGVLTPKWAQELGLPERLPVVAGGVDAAVATLAAGATGPGQHVGMIGTSMAWGTVRQRVNARHGLISMPHVFNGLHDLYVFGGAITAGASVSWFRDNFCQAEIAAGKAQNIDPHQLLEAAASNVPSGADGLLFLPYLMGERSPVWDAKASGAFVGLGLHHTRAHMYRAVLEGIAFALHHNIETGQRDGLPLNNAITVVGGASQSNLWMQIIANITARPVFTIAEEVEASLGAALLAALGSGLIDEEAARKGWVRLTERAQPQQPACDTYAAMYKLYVALYPALKPVMHQLRHVSQSQACTVSPSVPN